MTPENTGRQTALYSVYPDRTYHIDLSRGRIMGMCDGEEAIRQAVYKILATVRFENIIYSGDYGSSLLDCMDRLRPYVWAEIESTVARALMYDDRIREVKDFEFTEDRGRRALLVSFTVVWDKGSFRYAKEVEGYV